MSRRFVRATRRLQRLESSATAEHTPEADLRRRQGEWYTRFLTTLSVADLERLECWADGHLGDEVAREVATWQEARVQTYIDRTGDSRPNTTVGDG